MPMRSEVAWKYNFGLEVILVEMDYIIVMEGKLVTAKTHLKQPLTTILDHKI